MNFHFLKYTVKNYIDIVLDGVFSSVKNLRIYNNNEFKLDFHAESEIKYWLEDYLSDGRLALIVTSLGTGGTERYVRDLAIGFAKLGLRPIVIVDNNENHIGLRELEFHNVELFFLGIENNINSKFYIKLLKNVILSKKIKLLHDNTWIRSDLIKDVCFELEISYFAVCHTTYYASVRSLLGLVNTFDNIWIQRYKYKRNKLSIISTSKMSTVQLGYFWGSSAKIVTVPLGVPVQESFLKTHNSNSIRLIWIGSFIERKRPLNMLMAFEMVLEKYPQSSLVMLGDGPLFSVCKNYAEERFPNNVQFPGFVENVFAFLNHADIFVMTSVLEGLSYVTLEAMACCLPVITTDCGVVKEVVVNGDTGFIVKKDDINELVTAIHTLAGDTELIERMGKAGFYRCKSNFTLERMINGTLNAYRSLTEPHTH